MAFDFPANPVLDDVYTPIPGRNYIFNGVGWDYMSVNTALSITLLLPAFMEAGGTNIALRVMGLGFMPTSVVYMDGVAIPTTFASSEELQADVSADTQTAKVVAITVRNGAIESNILPLNFVAIPTLTTIVPTSVAADTGLVDVVCTGTGYIPESLVYVNWREQVTTFTSATSLTVSVDTSIGGPGDSLYIHVQTGQRIMSNQLLLDFT